MESVQVGDCYSALGTDDVDSLSELPCAQPHENEVFYVYTMNPGPYPSDQQLDRVAEDTCSAHLGDYVGETAIDGFDFDYILPTQAGWDFGRRSILCSLHRLDGTRITGTARVASWSKTAYRRADPPQHEVAIGAVARFPAGTGG